MKTIVFYSKKGGIGKTSLATSTAFMLAGTGKKTLLIDADSQGNSSTWLGWEEGMPEFSEYLRKEKSLPEVILDIGDGLHLAGSSAESGKLDNFVQRDLEDVYHLLDVKNDLYDLEYDFIIWDCSPSSSLLNDAILMTADVWYAPMTPEFFSLKGVAALNQKQEILGQKGKKFNISVPYPQIIINALNKNYKQHREIMEAMEKTLDIKAIFPTDPAFRNSQGEIEPVFKWKPKQETMSAFNQVREMIING